MPATTADQRTIWPGYTPANWYDGFPLSAWNNFADYAQQGVDRTGSIAIMNPDSGPGSEINYDWTAVANYARGRNHKVVGYVDTNYAARAAGDVLAEVNRYREWYGADGVVLDRMSNDVATMPYYRDIYAAACWHRGQIVVGNPGAAAETDWQLHGPERVADILVVFEDTAAAYLTWEPPSWVAGYGAHRFGHLVHTCDSADLAAVIEHSRATGAGYRYITDDVMPNPWDVLGHWPKQFQP